MKARLLSIHIIVNGNFSFTKEQNVLVQLARPRQIREFRSILDAQRHEEAMLFALSNGRRIFPEEARGTAQLILTKASVYWDIAN